MSQTVDNQISKCADFVCGMRPHLADGNNFGVTAASLDELERKMHLLKALNDESETLKAQMHAKVAQVRETFEAVTAEFLALKKEVKVNVPQEHWCDYGIHDKR
ncbi:MAG: hypothetical protein ACI30K_03055 [Muribaculaceae bacterium]